MTLKLTTKRFSVYKSLLFSLLVGVALDVLTFQ